MTHYQLCRVYSDQAKYCSVLVGQRSLGSFFHVINAEGQDIYTCNSALMNAVICNNCVWLYISIISCNVTKGAACIKKMLAKTNQWGRAGQHFLNKRHCVCISI